MAKKIVSRGEIKKAMYLYNLNMLDVRKAPVIEGYELEPYIITVNMMQEINFQYNHEEKKFYLDEHDQELMDKEIAEHTAEAKRMEEEGKSEEEIKEYFKGKGTQYINRVEYILDCDDLHDKVSFLVSQL